MGTNYPSLEDILRLSFSESVAWLGGDSSVPRAVHWVVTSISDAHDGDVLLLPDSELNSELVAAAHKQGLSALLLVGDAMLPDGLQLGDLVIAAIPDSYSDLREIHRLLLTVLINQRAALTERAIRIHVQLSQLEAEGKGLKGLAKAMADISGKGVLIQDKRGNYLAEHPSSTLSTIWKDVLNQLSALESLPEFLIDRKRAGNRATIHSQTNLGGLARLITPIIVGEIARGYLSLVGLDGEFDELDHLVIEQGGMVCAIEMARNKAVREAEKRLKGDLLSALLHGNLSPREAALWVQSMGLDLTQAHVAMRFTWDAPTPPSRRRLETLIHGEILRHGLQVIISPMGSEVICFCQIAPDSKRPDKALAFGQAVLDQGAREYPQIPCRCGVGAKAKGLEEWRNSLRQAGQALELASRIGERVPLYYPDLSVYRLLFQLEHSPELITFQEETLGTLLSYEGAEEMLHILETYFQHNGNLSQTAEALFMHRNTLIYRMERIATITNIDLDNPEERLAMQLALRINRMIGNKPN